MEKTGILMSFNWFQLEQEWKKKKKSWVLELGNQNFQARLAEWSVLRWARGEDVTVLPLRTLWVQILACSVVSATQILFKKVLEDSSLISHRYTLTPVLLHVIGQIHLVCITEYAPGEEAWMLAELEQKICTNRAVFVLVLVICVH